MIADGIAFNVGLFKALGEPSICQLLPSVISLYTSNQKSIGVAQLLNRDTDLDGWSDKDELLANTSPFDPLDHPASTGLAIDMNTVYIAAGCIAAGFVVGLVAGIAAKKKRQTKKDKL